MDRMKQILMENSRNAASIRMLLQQARLTIQYAEEALRDNRTIEIIVFNEGNDNKTKAQEILGLFEDRELNDHIKNEPECEFQAALLQGLRRIRSLAVGIDRDNGVEKELVNAAF